MKGRNVPLADITADDRRIQACLEACANISTEALEAGLVHASKQAEALLVTGIALAAEIAAQGKNPAQYVDFARMVKQFTALNGRVERSGYNEAQNRAWERRNGRPLEADKGVVLAPLGKRVRHA